MYTGLRDFFPVSDLKVMPVFLKLAFNLLTSSWQDSARAPLLLPTGQLPTRGQSQERNKDTNNYLTHATRQTNKKQATKIRTLTIGIGVVVEKVSSSFAETSTVTTVVWPT